MKIAFQIMGNNAWYGGIAYLKNLLHAINYSHKKPNISLIAGDSTVSVPDILRQEVGEVIYFPTFRKYTIRWALNCAANVILGNNYNAEYNLVRHEVDVVFKSLMSQKYARIPTLSFIPDFQHIHFPELFSKEEIYNRNEKFKQTAQLASRIVLMSETVKKDLQAFTPEYAHKARVIKIVSHIPESIYSFDLKQVLEIYHLPGKFIYLPNQFWKHKNHEIVFKALHILKQQGIEIVLVCTGYAGDYRHAAYFTDLIQNISKLGIRNQVIYLGMIPHEHVLLLMRQSICVINPSLFEGWGITVDEVRSMGKSLILSDIQAHREQDCPRAIFFDPKDSDDLAVKIKLVWKENLPGPDFSLEAEARQNLPNRLNFCADSFMSVINEVIK